MDVTSEMTASVWKVQVAVNDVVEAGQTLMILESMKMEIPVDAPVSGRVTQVNVAEGDSVHDGQLLACIE